MKNNYKKIIIFLFIVFCSLFFFNQKASASSVILKPSNTILGVGEQFYVDVMIDTNGKMINGIDASINFSSQNISFIRAEEGGSIINLWVEKPNLKGNTIELSGIIPNGFGGVIDPFNPKERLPGLVIRLVFETKNNGTSNISLSKSYATLNDGKGTTDNIPDNSILLNVQNINIPFIYKTKGDAEPEISAYVIRDTNLFDNKYTLIFDAKDNQTGIKEVLIKEGKRDWKKIESPYLLEDQSRHSIITLQATNYSGASIVMNIENIPYKLFSVKNITVIILLFIVLFFVFKKIYEKYK